MKKITLLFCLLFSVSLFAKQTPIVKVIEQAKKRPIWVELPESIGKYKGKKVIYFIGFGISRYKGQAREAAKLNSATAAAVAISAIATKQVAKAWESFGISDNEQKEQVMKGLEALSSKKINVSGLLRTAFWWRYIVKSKIRNGKVVGWSKPLYEYYYRYALDYNEYLKRRDKALEDLKKKTKKKKKVIVEEPEDEPEEKKEVKKEEPEEKEKEVKKKKVKIKTRFDNTLDDEDEEDDDED